MESAKRFDAFVTRFIQQARDLSNGLQGKYPIKIEDLRSLEDNTDYVDRFDRASATQFFNAEAAELDMQHTLEQGADENKAARKVAIKLISDLLGQVERDEKLRRVTRVRAYALEASRQDKHSNRGGPWQNNYQRIIQGLMKQ